MHTGPSFELAILKWYVLSIWIISYHLVFKSPPLFFPQVFLLMFSIANYCEIGLVLIYCFALFSCLDWLKWFGVLLIGLFRFGFRYIPFTLNMLSFYYCRGFLFYGFVLVFFFEWHQLHMIGVFHITDYHQPLVQIVDWLFVWCGCWISCILCCCYVFWYKGLLCCCYKVNHIH